MIFSMIIEKVPRLEGPFLFCVDGLISFSAGSQEDRTGAEYHDEQECLDEVG